MAAFSVNQVRQLYVVNAYKKNEKQEDGIILEPLVNPGDVSVGKDKAGNIFLQYVGALGDIMRSDLITNISYAKGVSAKKLAYKLKGATLTLDPDVNGGQPVAGQDYLLRLAFREYIGMSEADQYFKYGMVHVFPGLKASDFYKEMALSLAANISKDVTALVDIYLYDGTTETKVEEGVDPKSLTGTYTALRIAEAVQPWHLGTMPQGVIPFSVQPTTVLVDGDQRIWGEVESYDTKAVLPEGQLIADLEYFCMGERGDQYRNMGWPNVIPTKYMVDPSKEYDVITIHYAFQGDGVSIQKSEKDIQIACPVEGDSHALANAVITAINSAAGLSIEAIA